MAGATRDRTRASPLTPPHAGRPMLRSGRDRGSHDRTVRELHALLVRASRPAGPELEDVAERAGTRRGGSVGGVDAPVDLNAPPDGSGPLWGMQSGELNATLLAWPPGGGVAEHVNDELEVLVVVLSGSVRVTLAGAEHELAAGHLLLVPRGCARAIAAGPAGVRYLSVHRRRAPLLPAAR